MTAAVPLRRVLWWLLTATLAFVLADIAVAAGGYRNPTPGSAIALQIAGMDRARVQRDLVYARRDGLPLRLDVYRPRSARREVALPALLLVHGTTTDPSPKDWGIYVGWGQLLAASGLVAVAFNHSGHSSDVKAALTYVRQHGARLGIDPTRLCLASFSLGVPVGLHAALGDRHLRCVLLFYGPPTESRLRADAPPTLIAKAGLDDPAINDAIDRYRTRARAAGADVRVITHNRGVHGFDALNHDERSRTILRTAIRFAKHHLEHD